MRSISANAITELAKKKNYRSVIIIAVQWVDGGSFQEYAEIEIPKNAYGNSYTVPGKIIDVDGIDNVITIQGTSAGTSGDSQEVKIILDDTEEDIKDILDNNDVHKRPVLVYQWFEGLDFSDRFLLFKGQISSPLEWDVADRSAKFDVINRIEDVEVGFSIEEGNFQTVDPELIGKAWPLVFGTCIHVPALQVRSPFSGTLGTGVGVSDFTKQPRIDQLEKMCCPLIFRGWNITLTLGGQEAHAVFSEDPSCYCRRQAEIQQLTSELAVEKTFEYTSIEVLGGTVLPQGTQITLNICDALFTGSFQGTNANPDETFVINKREHPAFATTTIPKIKNFCGIRPNPFSPRNPDFSATGGAYSTRDQLLFTPTTCGDTDVDSDGYGWEWYATFPVEDFFWAEPGCKVFIQDNTEIVYVANLLPSTVLRVAAYRTFESSGIRELVTVPSSYYTTRLSNFNEYTVTEIVMDRQLSLRGEGYEDDIYVSQTSSVGPNTVDIMEWLIDKYTDFTYDASFADVKTKIDNYPSNFALLERENIINVLQEMAFQSRCALILRNDVFSLIYLAEEPSVDFTITEADIVPDSFVLSHTDTEDLVTRFVAEWRSDYAKEERIGPNKRIVSYNTPRDKYGVHKQTFDFFIYNIHELVLKSATFWLIRMANTWRKIKVKTYLHKLQGEVLDCVEVTLPDFAPGPIKCLVDKATYNSEDHTIDFELWTPVRSGEQVAFDFAWPANISVSKFWPTRDDRLNRIAGGGDSPNVDVEPPASHPLALPPGFTVTNSESPCHSIGAGEAGPSVGECRQDHGDSVPSDTDDTKPTVKVPGQGEGATSLRKGPTGQAPQWIQNQFADNNAQQDQINRNSAGAGEGQGEGQFDNDTGEGNQNDTQEMLDDLEEARTECNDPGECWATVRVGYIPVTSVWTGTHFSATNGDTGQVVGNQTINNFEYFEFNSLCAAQQFRERMDQIIESYSATVGGGLWPINTAMEEICWGPGCEEPAEPSINGYTDSTQNGDGAAAPQGFMDNGSTYKDENDADFTPPPVGPCQ